MSDTLDFPPRVDVIGSQINACTSDTVFRLLDRQIAKGDGGYVCFSNAHTAVMGRRNSEFRTITNDSFLSLADGKSVYWAAKAKHAPAIEHIPGPDFMIQTLRRFPDRGHFFYGSSPHVLTSLVNSLQQLIPTLNISGSYSPPFRPLTKDEREDVISLIQQSRAMFIWVGLGAPKQENWMSDMWQSLRPAILFGVGAAFDFHAGSLQRAPLKIRRIGLEWLYRLSQEPARLWKRYLVTNSLFIYYLMRRNSGS